MEEGGFGPLLLQVLRKYGENLEKKGFQYGHPNQRIDDILNCAEECQRDTRLRTAFKKDRQHSSMQGVINCAGLASVFRSEIEWLRLIRDDLTAECSWNNREAGK